MVWLVEFVEEERVLRVEEGQERERGCEEGLFFTCRDPGSGREEAPSDTSSSWLPPSNTSVTITATAYNNDIDNITTKTPTTTQWGA